MRNQNYKNRNLTLSICPVAFAVFIACFMSESVIAASDEVEFNIDVLDVKERNEVDINRFSRAGYLMPGEYLFNVVVNKSEFPEEKVSYLSPQDKPDDSLACLSPDLVSRFGFKENEIRKAGWWQDGQCLDVDSLPGMTVTPDLGSGILKINIPQSLLEYTSENWEPPSRWDDGIPGFILDYYLNARHTQSKSSSDAQSLSGNGVAGFNIGPWRLRANWQGDYERESGKDGTLRKNFKWDRFYIFRAIKSLKSELTVGESYLPSTIFDSFRFTGASLTSDDAQLAPNLRGYAPEVVGVAKSNAKVTVSQQGSVIYETTVASGPFRIQDLNNAVMGKLDVTIQEQDGTRRTFQVDTATIPYLTRPGSVRYKLAIGKPSDYEHHTQNIHFATGELSWGISNGWSVYGGGLFANDYLTVAAGMGRDLLALGALSLDVTSARAKLNEHVTRKGNSYRLSYSKRFDDYDSQITFAGYRFSDRNYMTMSQFLSSRTSAYSNPGKGKELYTITIAKQLRKLNAGIYLSYNHQTYWERAASDTWNLSLSSNFDMGRFKNASLSLTGYRTQYDHTNDDGVYLSLSLPFGEGTLSYSGQTSGGTQSQNVGWRDNLGDNSDYNVDIGTSSDGEHSINGYLDYTGSIAEMTASAGFENNGYRTLGLSVEGGMTATAQGAALHRSSGVDGTRLMVDTAGISDVAVSGGGNDVKTNYFGKAVVTDINSYYRSNVNIDLDELPDDVEATRSVVEDTLTKGAIGYRKFGILAGQKGMAIVKLEDGSVPPFGAMVKNEDKIQTGIIAENGRVWLSGMKPGGKMDVSWNGKERCIFILPEKPDEKTASLLLPCINE
ncbi:outer membrane usher protein [Pantoea sp. CS_6]|uniref:outer membrane usher protein n=1 Tax=Pantoea sp. CS_6 TaxID=3055795 RepID=UPI0035BEED9F